MRFGNWTQHQSLIVKVLLLVILWSNLSVLWTPSDAYAQGRLPPARSWTSTLRRWVPDWDPQDARLWKAHKGEDLVDTGLDALSRNARYELEERYATHEVLQHGIDAIYRNVKTKRFNIVEAKATTSTGRLSLGILPVRAGGERQMDVRWIRKKLDEAAFSARRILDDDAADAAQKMSAHRTLNMIDDISQRPLAKQERTLVITRINGIDKDLLLNGHTITSELRGSVDHVIEVSRSGRVLRVH